MAKNGKTLNVGFSEQEWRALEGLATAAGVSMSEIMRRGLVRIAAANPETPGVEDLLEMEKYR